MAATWARSGGGFPTRPSHGSTCRRGINPVALSRGRPADRDLVAPADARCRTGAARRRGAGATASRDPATRRRRARHAGADPAPAAPGAEIAGRRRRPDLRRARAVLATDAVMMSSASPDLAGAAGADVVVVVNPDNPTGRRLCRRRRCAPSAASLLVVDEAFIDLLPAETSLAGDLPTQRRRPAILRQDLRSGRRAPGFRDRASAASPQRIRDELGPWAVSGPALEIGRRRAGRRCLAADGGGAAGRRSEEARCAAGRGGIRDPGRNAAVPAGQPSRGATT